MNYPFISDQRLKQSLWFSVVLCLSNPPLHYLLWLLYLLAYYQTNLWNLLTIHKKKKYKKILFSFWANVFVLKMPPPKTATLLLPLM